METPAVGSTNKVVLSPEGRICDISDGSLAYFEGGQKAELLDRNLFELLASQGNSQMADKLYLATKSARAGQVSSFEANLSVAGGPARECICSVRPRFAGDELVFYELGILEVSQNPTETQYIQESERHFEALFDSISMAMLVVREGSIIRANAAAADLLGAPDLQFLKGWSLNRLFPELPAQTPAETRIRRTDGNFVKVELTITPWMLAGRRHSVLVCYDLGSQERMREVLQAATLAAEQASLAKSRLLTTMSHELRTPLNGILGLLHLAQRSQDPEKHADYLARLERATQGLLSIVNDVLDFSSVEKGETALTVVDFELNELETNVRNWLGDWTRDRPELAVEVSFAPDLPSRISGDYEKLLKILLTIAHNAVKFTPKGKIEVRAELLAVGEGNCSLCFSASDTGIGMSPEQLEKAFSPFTQVDSSASRYYGGIGLSLALCKRFAELMGGTLGVETQLGAGSRFFLTAPFGLPDLQQAPARKSVSNHIGEPSCLQGRALVVDDNDTNQEVAAELLRQLGLEVAVAGNGWQALEQCKTADFDVILMDLQMPGLDGLEATRRLRSSGCPAPIVALTANTRPEDQEACREAGMNGFLAKPVDPEVLYQALRPFLALKTEQRITTRSQAFEMSPVAGVDLEKGLHRLGGNQRLFRTLLIQFGRRHSGHGRRIRQAVDSGNLKEVRELSHTLKGSAGNLGIEQLASLSQQIEAAARAGNFPTDTILAALDSELERVIPEVLALDQCSESEGSQKPVAREEVRDLLAELLAQLDRDLNEAFASMDHLGEFLRDTTLAVQGAQLRNYLEEFEIERARELIQELLNLVG